MYPRGFDADTETVEDEPEKDAETVLTMKLTVKSDLEPVWTLVSERATAQGSKRNLNWGDRVRLAPTRIGAMADYHPGWRRDSVSSRISDERVDASAALAEVGRGGHADRPFERAAAFHALGYRVAVIRDDDKKPTPDMEQKFVDDDGEVFAWRDGRALEDELFLSLSRDGVAGLLDRAVELHDEALVNEHIEAASSNAKNPKSIRAEFADGEITLESRAFLGKAARAFPQRRTVFRR